MYPSNNQEAQEGGVLQPHSLRKAFPHFLSLLLLPAAPTQGKKVLFPRPGRLGAPYFSKGQPGGKLSP